MLRLTSSLLIFAIGMLGCNIAKAGIILTPTGVNPGDKFRIVFVMRGTSNATSSNALDYDNVVIAAASNAALTYNGSLLNWQAIVSTAATNANDPSRLPTSSTSPIFRIDGVKIANNGADFWDGSILAPIQIDETGALLTSRQVFTGTDVNGFSVPGLTLGNASGNAVTGDTDFQDSQWVNRRTQLIVAQHRLYAISQELTSAVPEPHSLVLFGMAVFPCLLARFRRSNG